MTVFNVLTSYPDMYPGPLSHGVIGKALHTAFKLNVVNIRDFDKTTHIDDRPFGGGAGMVMKPEPIHLALESLQDINSTKKIFLTPRGKILSQTMLKILVSYNSITVLCGAFEGVDQRVVDKHRMEEISIGDYIIPNGDYANFILISGIVRLLSGTLGNPESAIHESHCEGMLGHAQYTRPASWRGVDTPPELLKGNHKVIQSWRRQDAMRTTKSRRPDLLDKREK